MNRVKFVIPGIFILILVILALLTKIGYIHLGNPSEIQTLSVKSKLTPLDYSDNPLSIRYMRKQNYPGSDIKIETNLPNGINYKSYIVSYLSDGLKINALLTIPTGDKPVRGWPVIIFNHGYIPPEIYRSNERYIAYVDAIAKSGYIVFKPDYRGNGLSEGAPEGAYYSPAYAIDVLNALASIKKYPDVNIAKIGMWGHSMGGNITLRDIVVDTTDIKAAVIWGGVVGSYDNLMNNWQRNVSFKPSPTELARRNNYRKDLLNKFGTPISNPIFWQAIDPIDFLSDIKTPLQLHTGGSDEEVPISFSVNLKDKMEKLGLQVEYYNYPGGDHNIASPNFEIAMKRTIEFFDRYLKTT